MAKYKSYTKQFRNGFMANLDNAMDEIGMVITTEAKINTPVDTGNLRQENAYKTGAGRGTLAVGNSDRNAVIVGDLVPYALPVHFGTYKMAGRPWLWNAIVTKAGSIFNILARRLRR